MSKPEISIFDMKNYGTSKGKTSNIIYVKELAKKIENEEKILVIYKGKEFVMEEIRLESYWFYSSVGS